MITEQGIPAYMEHIQASWYAATDIQRSNGERWYWVANELARELGSGDTRMGAGLLAALSPNKSWDINQKLAREIVDTGIFRGHVSNALEKARAIMSGVDPALVLPMERKTGAFFMNIWRPDLPEWVTVDRHAIRVATWDWSDGNPTVTRNQYAILVKSYVWSARDLGIHANVVQAGTWEWARER